MTSYFDDDEAASRPWPAPPQGHFPDLPVDDYLRLHNTYAAVVTYFDAQVEALLDGLGVSGKEALFVLTARCGLPLGEHGVVGLTPSWLHEELIHVPLMLRFPKTEHGGVRVSALTQPQDLMATLGDFLGRAAAPADSQSLLRVLDNPLAALRPYVLATALAAAGGERALRSADWALLLPGGGAAKSDAPRAAEERGPQLSQAGRPLRSEQRVASASGTS